MIWSHNKLEKVIQKSVLKRARGVCVPSGKPPYHRPIADSEGAVTNLSYDIYQDILKAAKKDDSLYLELYL